MTKEKPLERILNTYVPIEGFTPAISLEKEPIEKRLQHYGVPGMKWGVRKEYEPHPLQKSSSGQRPTSKSLNKYGLSVSENIKNMLEDGKRSKEAAKIEKRLIKTYKKSEKENNKIKKQDEKNKRLVLKKKEIETSADEDKLIVNEHLKDTRNGTMNCVNCSVAYDLRRRDFDVVARGNFEGKKITDLVETYDNPNVVVFKSPSLSKKKNDQDVATPAVKIYNPLLKELAKNGDGARGIILLRFNWVGGHALNWEVKKGKAELVDSQSSYDPKLFFSLNRIRSDEITYFRTDNISLTENRAGLFVDNRKSENVVLAPTIDDRKGVK